MTKAVYPKAKEALLKGDIDLDGNVKIALVDSSTGGAPYDAADQFLSDIAGGVLASTGNLSGKDMTNGTFSSDDAAAVGVDGDTGELVTALVGYRDTGVAATSRLIWFEDEDIDNAPLTPDGGNVVVECPTAGWFTL